MAEGDRFESKSKSRQNFYIWEMNQETKEILVSANAERVHGFPVGNNLESMLATIHLDDLALLTDKIHRALVGLEPLEDEVRYIHPVTSEIIWLRIEGQLLYNNGASPRLIGIARNITGPKRARENLRLSVEQLRAFFENAGVGMVQIDIDLRYLRVNDRFCQITGYSREELLNMTPLDLDHPDEREVDRERLRCVFEGTGQEYNVEKRYVRKDGKVIWVHVTGTIVRDDAGNLLQTAAVIEDITRRKEAEERIGQQNAVLDGINRIFREALTCQTEEEIRRVCLQVAEEVTGSNLGFIGEVNAQGLLDDIAISDLCKTACKIENITGHHILPTGLKIHGIYGRVLIDDKPVLTNDPGSHPDSIGMPPGHMPITAFLGVPLKDQGKTIGMVAVANREGGYRIEDQAALEALSEAMVQALMRWRANKQLADDYAVLTRLHEVSTQFDDNIDTIFNVVLEVAVAITRADCGTIHLLDQTGQLCLLSAKNMAQRVLDRFGKVSIESGCSCAEALRLKQRVIVVDYQTDMRFAQYTESTRVLNAAGIQASQSTPLVSRTGHLIGMLSTHWCEPHQPADHVLHLIDLLARQAADLIERKQAEEALRQSEKQLAEELMSAKRLQYLSTQMIQADQVEELYDKILDTAMEILCADFASMQLYHPGHGTVGELKLLGHRGFSEYAAKSWERVRPESQSTCGMILHTRQRVFVPDVLSCEPMQGSDDLKTYLHTGIRAVQTTPLISRTGNLLGVFSTHWREPHVLTNSEIRSLDVLARMVADLMERKQAEVALRESEERYRALAEDLQLGDRRKDEFIGMLSHEIRNPLTSIKLGMTMLNRSAPGSEQAAKMKEIIDRQITQLTRLIDDLLDVTRIAQNKIALQKGPLELNELVRKTVQDYQALFQEKGVRLEVACSPANLCLEADAARLAQVVGNLLHNAAKFTSGGGSVQVTVFNDWANQLAVINIKDNGMGIEPEMLASIFVPFMQADTSLDRGQSGLGLGLALVKGLVELHSGDLTVQSDGPGKGAEFIVRLPLAGEELAAIRPETTPRIPSCSRRVLIIEDIIDVAYMLKSLLEKDGHQVMVAHNGNNGIILARTFRPEVLLCDIGLPGMNGYEVARTFCNDEELKHVFLVSLTGYARPEDLRRAREAGFHCQLAKPVDLTILKQTLANLYFS